MKHIKTTSVLLTFALLLFLGFGCNEVERTDGNNNGTSNGTNSGQTKVDDPVEPTPVGPMGFEKTEHDFGTIRQGDSVVVSYPFVNNTVTQLEIERFYTSCGCITAVGPDHPLEPGERGEVVVTFDSKNQPIARYEKIVSVAFINKPNYLLPLHLNGSVVQ